MQAASSLLGLHEVRSRYPARIVRTNDLEWRIRDTGGGRTVQIFLPGSLGNADIFYLQLLHLASRVRCIAIDYPGAQTAALADGLAALLDTLEIDRANLLGSSLAGYLAADLRFAAPPADQIADPGQHVSRVPRSAQPSAVLDPNTAGRGRRSSQSEDAFPIESPRTGSPARPADRTFARWPKWSVVAGAAACGGDSAARADYAGG